MGPPLRANRSISNTVYLRGQIVTSRDDVSRELLGTRKVCKTQSDHHQRFVSNTKLPSLWCGKLRSHEGIWWRLISSVLWLSWVSCLLYPTWYFSGDISPMWWTRHVTRHTTRTPVYWLIVVRWLKSSEVQGILQTSKHLFITISEG